MGIDFDKTVYKLRHEVERAINALDNFRALASRVDERAVVFHGAVAVAVGSIRLRLRLSP